MIHFHKKNRAKSVMPPGWTGGVKIVPQEQCLPSIDSNRHSVQFATIFNYFIQEIRLAVFYSATHSQDQ